LLSDDFELICTNAMTYNQKDTIFYKAAKRLLHLGKNLMSAKKLLQLREQLPFMRDISAEEIGFDINSPIHEDPEDDDDDDDSRDISKVIEDIREVVKRPLGRFEAIPDDLSPQEILEQAQRAARDAANRLKLHRPNSQMGFLSQKPDGTTSLSFLPGGSGVGVAENDRPISLSALVGKVKTVSDSVQEEDRRDSARSAHPLSYGAYSSHAPTHDSTFASLTSEETDLVFSTYGDEVGVQYAESILNYSRNCDYAMFIVDHLLDILTQNEHRKTTKYLEEKKSLRREDQLLCAVFDPSTCGEEGKASQLEDGIKQEVQPPVDFGSLKSLSDDGIDVSFLDSLQSQYMADPSLQLQETANLLAELKQLQLERLSQPHAGHAPKAGDKEQQLADSIRANLTHLVKNFKPTDLVPEECVRKLLGAPIKVKLEKDECVGEQNPYAVAASDVE
jgi:bromodomain-containing protein 7/9